LLAYHAFIGPCIEEEEEEKEEEEEEEEEEMKAMYLRHRLFDLHKMMYTTM
jgi:CO dehydrogenase/acetyl-CoA synthase beta subunit